MLTIVGFVEARAVFNWREEGGERERKREKEREREREFQKKKITSISII